MGNEDLFESRPALKWSNLAHGSARRYVIALHAASMVARRQCRGVIAVRALPSPAFPHAFVVENRKISTAYAVATPTILTVVRRVLGAIVVVFTGAVMAAWLFHAEILRSAVSPYGTMVFNAALSLALLGSGLLLMDGARAWQRRTMFMLGAAVVALAGLTLAEHLTRLNLGVDLPELHRWLQDRAPAPGRMAVGTSVAILLLGFALCLWPYAARRHLGVVIQVLAIFALLIALLGIIIREMQLQYLYSSYVLSAMALHTAFGIMFVGIGFWLGWHRAPWNRLLTFTSDEQRIKSSGTVILLAIAISTGFVGFYASQDALNKSLSDSHMQTLAARVHQVETVLEQRMIQAGAISTRLDLQERLHQASRQTRIELVVERGARVAVAGRIEGRHLGSEEPADF